MSATRKVDINDETYTQVNLTLGTITVEAIKHDVKLAISPTQPVKANSTYHLIKAGKHIKFERPEFDCWVLATESSIAGAQGDSEVIVTEDVNTTKTTTRGDTGISVIRQNSTSPILKLPFLKSEGELTLAADTVIGVNTIVLTPGHGLTTVSNAGDFIEIADSTNGSKFMQAEIVTVTVDTVLLDSPVNQIYTTTESTLLHSKSQMNLDGSVTPVIFNIAPTSLQSGDISRALVVMTDNADMDFEKFGAAAKLTNGVVIRVNNGDGTYRNLNNFKTNGDIINQCFDHEFFANNGGGTRGFTARAEWAGEENPGSSIRLDGALGEKLEIVIQDDLTSLLSMQWFVQGSELE